MYKVAILYIALGKYDKFWEEFYKSCEWNFLSEMTKDYYVFTDSVNIKEDQQVHLISAQDQGWPRNTLDRFFFFDRISEHLQKYDYCFFFNANTCFLKNISPGEVLPGKEHDYLVNLSWHTEDVMKSSDFPYERNPVSTACIPLGEGLHYFQGGLIGGRSKEFLEMKDVLIRQIKIDYKNDFIAVSHDESHLNRYLIDKHPLCLSTYYGRPQEWAYPSEPAIIFRKKEDVLGIFYIFRLKGKSTVYVFRHFIARIKQILRYK